MKMKRMVWCMVMVTVLIFGMVCTAVAAPMDDAKALVDKALAFIKANGIEKAVAEINGNPPKGQLSKDDIYVVIQDFKGVILAHGGNPKLVGQNHWDVKDPSGKYFVREQVEVAKTKSGGGMVDLVWTNPATKKVQPKTNFVKKIEGKDIMVMAGVFK
jgi:cytochrome c